MTESIEQQAARRAALERERAGISNRLARSPADENLAARLLLIDREIGVAAEPEIVNRIRKPRGRQRLAGQ